MTRAPVGDKLYRDERWLRQKYLDEQIGIPDIAQLAGCGNAAVHYWLKKFNIKRRSPSEATSLAHLRGAYGDEWRKKQALVSRRRAKEELGSKIYHSERWLRKHYIDLKLSTCQIAEIAECSSSTILHWMNYFGIPRRTIGETTILHWNKGTFEKQPEKISQAWENGDFDHIVTRQELICDNCGETFTRNQYAVNAYNYHFCSRECQSRWQSNYRRGENHPNWIEREFVICEGCSKAFLVNPKARPVRRFCSPECVHFRTPTSIEKETSAALDIMGIDHNPQFSPIGFRGIYDELVYPDVLLEINGDYWHSTPDAKRRDKRKAEWARLNGYKLVVFWEHEIQDTGAWSLVIERVVPLIEGR